MRVEFCEKSSPFIDYYEKIFSRALDDGNFSVLDSTIQSLYSLCNGCLADVVMRLTDLAITGVDNDFVESLIFFLEVTTTSDDPEKSAALKANVSLVEKLTILASCLKDEDDVPPEFPVN